MADAAGRSEQGRAAGRRRYEDARTITGARLQPVPDFAKGVPSGQNAVIAALEDGTELQLFTYYTGELRFRAGEFRGLTVREAAGLFAARDIAYLRSPEP